MAKICTSFKDAKVGRGQLQPVDAPNIGSLLLSFASKILQPNSHPGLQEKFALPAAKSAITDSQRRILADWN